MAIKCLLASTSLSVPRELANLHVKGSQSAVVIGRTNRTLMDVGLGGPDNTPKRGLILRAMRGGDSLTAWILSIEVAVDPSVLRRTPSPRPPSISTKKTLT
jgi:hypothetical protein